MSTTLRLRISGPVTLHGKKPGDEFDVATDEDGVPLDLLWRKRLDDERKYPLGHVTIVTPQDTPAPATPPAASKKKEA